MMTKIYDKMANEIVIDVIVRGAIMFGWNESLTRYASQSIVHFKAAKRLMEIAIQEDAIEVKRLLKERKISQENFAKILKQIL
jgi:hypothetical protein